MSDDDDYMSDKFLEGSEKSTASSTLMYRYADKRKFELMKKKTEIETKLKQSSVKYIEEEKREAGLSSAITSTNKGSFLFFNIVVTWIYASLYNFMYRFLF